VSPRTYSPSWLPAANRGGTCWGCLTVCCRAYLCGEQMPSLLPAEWEQYRHGASTDRIAADGYREASTQGGPSLTQGVYPPAVPDPAGNRRGRKPRPGRARLGLQQGDREPCDQRLHRSADCVYS